MELDAAATTDEIGELSLPFTAMSVYASQYMAITPYEKEEQMRCVFRHLSKPSATNKPSH